MADSANLKSLPSPKRMAGGFATTKTDSAQFSIKTRLTKEASSSVQKRRQLFLRTHNESRSVAAMLESIAETQPQLKPALLRLSAMISQYFTRRILPLLLSTRQRQSDNVFDWQTVNDPATINKESRK